MWPRSANRPSEMSIAACAMPRAPGRAPAAAGAGGSARSDGCARAPRPAARPAAPRARAPHRPACRRPRCRRPAWRRCAAGPSPFGTSPIAVSDRVSGPGVDTVSPPSTEMPNSALSAARPAQNAASHSSSIVPRAGQRQQIADRRGAHGGEIGQVHPQQLLRDLAGGVVRRENARPRPSHPWSAPAACPGAGRAAPRRRPARARRARWRAAAGGAR